MRGWWGIVVALLLVPSLGRAAPAAADPHALGLGAVLGTPTGVCGKFRIDKTMSIAAAIGLGWGGVEATADGIYEGGVFWRENAGPHSESSTGATLAWYLGVGGRFATYDTRYYDRYRYHRYTEIGARVPVGVELGFSTLRPLEIFVEAAPGLVLVEDPGISLDIDLGFHWFF